MRVLFILLSALIISCTAPQEEGNSQQTDSLLKVISELSKKSNDLEKQNEILKDKRNYWFDIDYDGHYLTERGIDDPVAFIDSSLRNSTELLPLEGVLGGTMRFVKIQLIGSNWVLADYNDGHIQGRSIYRFELDENGNAQFEIIDSLHY